MPRAIRSTVLIAVLVCGLVAYKGSAAATALRLAATTGSIPATARVGLLLPGRTSSVLEAVSRSATYLVIVGPALLFGILISGAVRACVSSLWLTRALGRGPIRQQLAAGVAGAPLMLCSCCVAPVFSAVYERSRRAGPSLAVALAAPSLNPAALTLTYMLFQPQIAEARLALALVGVFAIAPLLARLAAPERTSMIDTRQLPEAPLCCGFIGFMSSCAHVAIRTVPLIFAGVVASMWLVQRVPIDMFASGGGKIAAIALASAIAVPVALPTFFEIPLALTLVNAGAPAGVAAAVLFAGPAINLPSLLVIGRATSWKLAVVTALAIGLLACLGGLLVG